MSAIKNVKVKISNRNDPKEGTEKPKPKARTKKRRTKKGDESDPLVTTISELLSTSLSIISPEEKPNAIEKRVNSDDLDKLIENLNGSPDELNPLKVTNKRLSESLRFGETFKVKIGRSSKKRTKSFNAGSESGSDCVIDEREIGSHKQSKCTNAFQLLMDSRRKVIGRNSPGKCLEEQENEAAGENKQKLRARKRLLQDWTIAKGSQKRQREEIEKEHYINRQLGNRAKKLKKLLKINSDGDESSADEVSASIKRKSRKCARQIVSDSDSEDLLTNEELASKTTDSEDEKVINLVESPEINCKSKNGVSERTSDTQRKKYMQRGLLKFFDVLVDEKLEDNVDEINKSETNERYVGIRTKSKDEEYLNGKRLDKGDEITGQSEKRFETKYVKGKRDENDLNKDQLEVGTLASKIVRKRGRPKKCQQHDVVANQNAKFGDNLEKTTIDSLKTREELADEFQDRKETRKSSRKCAMKPVSYTERDTNTNRAQRKQVDLSEDSNDGAKKISRGGKSYAYVEVVDDDDDVGRKETKLAPMFVKTAPRPKLDPSALKARNNFLRSGVPDSLKRKMEKRRTAEDVEHDVFPTISHVQQKNETPSDLWRLPKSNLKLAQIDVELPRLRTMLRGSVTASRDDERHFSPHPPDKIQNLKSTLEDIKTDNPKYPVNRSFRLLSKKVKKCKSSDVEVPEFAMLWTEKYKAKSNDEIFGNQSSTSQLKKWLCSWLEYSEEVPSKTKSKRRDSSASEFESTDEFDGDEPRNTVILTGPHGSGKTMTVYALCHEMGINVLELNASEKRTGKRLHQELQEATQSHQVRENNTNAFSTVPQSKKCNDESRRKMCLLLVEDVDVVFDQDEGFLSVLSQLLTTSKRPIVLVTTDTNCSHLQKFVAQYAVIKFSPLTPQVLTVWLQILCLLEGLKLERDCISEMLEWNQGDARKTLLHLQFWVKSCGSKSPIKQIKTHSNDSQEIATFVNPSFDLDKLWWNVPNMLKFSPITSTNDHDLVDLKSVSEIFETFAAVDVVRRKLGQQNFEHYKHGKVKHSLELGECMDDYCTHNDLADDWTSYLLKGRIESCGNFNVKLGVPSSKTQRWCLKRHSCGEKFLEIVPYSYHTDHRAVALDYFSTLRNMAREETHRANVNNKRRNRFSNYLRSIGLNLNEATNKTACNILNKDSQNTQFFD